MNETTLKILADIFALTITIDDSIKKIEKEAVEEYIKKLQLSQRELNQFNNELNLNLKEFEHSTTLIRTKFLLTSLRLLESSDTRTFKIILKGVEKIIKSDDITTQNEKDLYQLIKDNFKD